MFDGDSFIDHVPSEMVEFYGEVFGSCPCFVVGCDFDATPVVLERAAFDLWSREADFEALALQFPDEIHDGNHLPECGRKCNVLGFGSGERTE